MSGTRWWEAWWSRGGPAEAEPDGTARPAAGVDVWDCGTGLVDLVHAALAGTGTAVRTRDPLRHPVNRTRTHVLLVPVTDDQPDLAASRALTRALFLLNPEDGVPAPRFTVVWVVPRDVRHLMWVTQDGEGAYRNIALLTLASAWPRALARAGSIPEAVNNIASRTRSAVDELRQSTLLLPPTTGHLLRYVEILDPASRHLLLCQALGPGRWHGLEAVCASVAEQEARR